MEGKGAHKEKTKKGRKEDDDGGEDGIFCIFTCDE